MSEISLNQPDVEPSSKPNTSSRRLRLYTEERRVLRFLREQVPELAAPFVSSIPKARNVILNRLATSMLREDVAGLASNLHDLDVTDPIPAALAPDPDENRRKVVGSGRMFGPGDGLVHKKVFPLPGEECLIFSALRPYAFNRMEVEGPILHVRPDEIRPLQHSVELLQLIWKKETTVNGETQGSWSRFAEELRDGSANLALAYAYYEEKKKRLQRLAVECGAETTLDLAIALTQQDKDFDASLFFEQLCVEGHHLHPGAKTKIGMEPAAVYQYSPELRGAPTLQFVGIRRDRAEWATTGEGDINAILFEEYPGLREAVARVFATRKGLSTADYVFVPVHCWQMDRVIPKIYRDELARGIIVPVDDLSVPSRACASFRTVVPCAEGDSRRLAVKVSVNSQMTSSIRSISTNTTQNAPEFTRLILTVMQREPQLAATFVPVCEVAGLSFKTDLPEDDAELWPSKSRNLSAVLRESVESLVEPGELAIVGCSLYSESPVTGKPILAELVERYASSTRIGPLREAAFRFVSDYAAIALPGPLTMMVKYGIALEPHLQNSIPVFKDGYPVRLLFRDWGAPRIYSERLERRGLHANFCPGSVTITNDAEEMQKTLFYAVLQNHMAEVILQACKHFGASERELWREICRISDEVFERLASDPEHAEDALRDKEALHKAEAYYKALTKMRLMLQEEHSKKYVAVPNPLHEFHS